MCSLNIVFARYFVAVSHWATFLSALKVNYGNKKFARRQFRRGFQRLRKRILRLRNPIQ